MPPRFSEEITTYLKVSGPTTLSAITAHFAKWGADDEDIRMALEWLIREGTVVRELDRQERYRLKA